MSETHDPLGELVAAAQAAAVAGDYETAVLRQQEALALVQQAGESDELLVAQSVLLFNLANLYEANGRFPQAIAALEQVVALDERTHNPDLEQDRAALARMQRLAELSPEEREQLMLVELQATLVALSEQAQAASQAGEVATAVSRTCFANCAIASFAAPNIAICRSAGFIAAKFSCARCTESAKDCFSASLIWAS